MKLLCVGDVRGRFAVLLKRLEGVRKKTGADFDMILCVGSFFSSSNEDFDGAASESDRIAFETFNKASSVSSSTLYVLGPNCEAESTRYKDLNGYEMSENVVYLGVNGCFTTKDGLKVAYLSGSKEQTGPKVAHEFAFDQMKAMQVALKWDDSKYVGVDVLITSEWPAKVAEGVGGANLQLPNGSKLISKLAGRIRPRYHFCGLHGVHFERQPYRNHKVLAEAARHTTRFIALANVGNPEKKKWMYAFNIEPLALMSKSELVAQSADATDSPYADIDAEDSDARGEGKQFFYDMTAAEAMRNDNKRQSRGDHQHGGKRPRRRQPAGPCWFCLSGSEVEKHLVVSVGEHAYLALPKGGLTSEHVLILPIAHYPSLLEVPEDVGKEIDKFKSALKKCFKKRGKNVVFFERNYKSHHLQLQVVPVPKECADRVKSTFMDVASAQNIELTEIPEHSSLTQMAEPGSPYFYVEISSKERLFHRVRSGFPIQFGREALASPDLLDLEDRIDWRECKAETKDEEATLTKDFRSFFQPYDFTLSDDEDDA